MNNNQNYFINQDLKGEILLKNLLKKMPDVWNLQATPTEQNVDAFFTSGNSINGYRNFVVEVKIRHKYKMFEYPTTQLEVEKYHSLYHHHKQNEKEMMLVTFYCDGYSIQTFDKRATKVIQNIPSQKTQLNKKKVDKLYYLLPLSGSTDNSLHCSNKTWNSKDYPKYVNFILS
tara:strand:+ start:3738 stop:4256 length:519 start_codon:yes stop_codon:yes gene_type:complete